jgi:acetyl-CoA carboxylase biotin carboxyl carrier protein
MRDYKDRDSMNSRNVTNSHEQGVSWLERVEDLINVLEGSTISELELSEAGTEIIIRRRPGMILLDGTSLPSHTLASGQTGVPAIPGTGATGSTAKEDRSVAIIAPLMGVYYSAPSPTSPPFVVPGDMVYVGQVVALIEAMKVFNEIQAEVSGRVVALAATSGEVVQKGRALLRVEPV